MSRLAVRALLRLAPRGFRNELGDEILAVHELRRRERRHLVGRLAFEAREVLGLALVVFRCRLGGLPTTEPHPDERAWPRVMLAGAPLLALVGGGLGPGAGIEAGFVMMVVALPLLALGLLGRVSRAGQLSELSLACARVAAGSALALALAVVLVSQEVAPLGISLSGFRYFATLLLVFAVAGFALHGLGRRELPALPATTAGLGALLLAAGPLGGERLAELGMWLSVPAWFWLAFARWGRREPPTEWVAEQR